MVLTASQLSKQSVMVLSDGGSSLNGPLIKALNLFR